MRTDRVREAGIEAARVAACLIVICCHVLPYVIEGMDEGSFRIMFLRTLSADGVCVFWMITGMFLFSGKRYASVLRRASRRILLPLTMITFAVFLAGGFRFGRTVSYALPGADRFIGLLRSFLSLRNGVPGLDHLWFLYTYLWIILLYPVLNVFVSFLNGSPKRMAGMLAIILLLLFSNDLSQNRLCSFSHDSFHAVFAASLFVIAGHVFDRFRRERVCGSDAFGAFFFLLAAVIVDLARAYILVKDPGNLHLLYWYTLPGILVSVSLLCACMKLIVRCSAARPNLSERVSRLSSASFGIYLIHGFLIHILVRIDAFASMLHLLPQTFRGLAAYPVTFLMSCVVFIICYRIISLYQRAALIARTHLAK